VCFRVGDAVCPRVDQILRQMNPDVQVCGEVAFFSDRGEERAQFAIISAAGIDTPLIVPVSKIELVDGRLSAEARDTRSAPERTRDDSVAPLDRRCDSGSC